MRLDEPINDAFYHVYRGIPFTGDDSIDLKEAYKLIKGVKQ